MPAHNVSYYIKSIKLKPKCTNATIGIRINYP